jgi:hypothetical protein
MLTRGFDADRAKQLFLQESECTGFAQGWFDENTCLDNVLVTPFTEFRDYHGREPDAHYTSTATVSVTSPKAARNFLNHLKYAALIVYV